MNARRWGLVTGLAAVAIAAGYGVGHWVLRTPGPVTQTASAPATLTDLAGQSHSLDEWRGKLVLLNFWATWCPPCREEIPLLLRTQKQFADRNVQIVGVAIDNPEAVLAFQEQMHIDYPILMGGDDGITLMTRYGNAAGALPYSVFIAPDGRILRRKIGAFRGRELETSLQELLSHKTP